MRPSILITPALLLTLAASSADAQNPPPRCVNGVCDRLEDVRDRREDVRDRREDVRDRRENVRDRRENRRDRRN